MSWHDPSTPPPPPDDDILRITIRVRKGPIDNVMEVSTPDGVGPPPPGELIAALLDAAKAVALGLTFSRGDLS